MLLFIGTKTLWGFGPVINESTPHKPPMQHFLNYTIASIIPALGSMCPSQRTVAAHMPVGPYTLLSSPGFFARDPIRDSALLVL